MDYEYYMELCRPVILNLVDKYRSLKTEREDLIQEGCLVLFELINKMDGTKYSDKESVSYFKKRFEGHLKNMKVKEHEQMIGMCQSIYGDDEYFFNEAEISDVELSYKDDFLESVYEKRRIASRKYYHTHKQQCSEKHKKYVEENKEKVAQYNKDWFNTHKERKKEYDKKYYEKNKTKINERHRKYREEHRDELNLYQRERRKHIKEM